MLIDPPNSPSHFIANVVKTKSRLENVYIRSWDCSYKYSKLQISKPQKSRDACNIAQIIAENMYNLN